ncbi:hypothetical protein KY348_07125 [Candidatus Woesearchaeota archaeon]|nr:hypothetical protein [Candidatus Woesearchaeota archaeon]
MKKNTSIILIIIILLIVAIGYYLLLKQESKKEPQSQAITSYISDSNETLTIMNWNIQTFGKSKWNKTEVRSRILSIVPMADITFIQEIRDKSGDTFRSLCAELNKTHKCNISSRAGRSSSKEQYGIIYKKNIEILAIHDFNPDEKDRWERPPVMVSFKADDYEFIATNIHIKPDDVKNELQHLEIIYKTMSSITNRVWLGDFNADCSYYDAENKDVFLTEYWVIKDIDDTTVAYSDCAYDRIIINEDMKEEYLKYGIYTNITKEVSDHYPVWVELKIP